MRVLVAFDKFKGALSAPAACAAAAAGLRDRHPDWTLDLCPLTDGGEGFRETLTHAAGGRMETFEVSGPRDRRVVGSVGFVAGGRIPVVARARFGTVAMSADAKVAIIDLPSASGLALLAEAQRDPWKTTTYGTGELLHHAAARGAGAIILGVGGSATNDLGCGALAALGCKFLDAAGAVIPAPAPSTWEKIMRVAGRVQLPPLFIACDVNNPLLGPHGATATFGPQKGLRADDVPRLEAAAARMSALLCAAFDCPAALAEVPGAGAAGGIAFGLMAAAGAKILPGFELVAAWLDLPTRLAAADLVLTGEGRFDATSLEGKGPGSLVREVRRLGKPVHVFAGSLGVPADEFVHAITPPGMPLAAALAQTRSLLDAAIKRVF